MRSCGLVLRIISCREAECNCRMVRLSVACDLSGRISKWNVRLRKAVGETGRYGSQSRTDSGGGNGADDEDPRGGVEGDGGEAEVVGGGRDHRGGRPGEAGGAGAGD